jgi:anthranilate synthase component 1
MESSLIVFRDKYDNGIVVTKRIACDTLTPVQTFWALVGDGQGFLLESIPGSYSFIGRFSDSDIITIHEDDNPWAKVPLAGSRLCFEQDGLPPFIGGYVGYLGYDMVRGIEILSRPEKKSGFPDTILARAETLVVFDHLKQSVSLTHTIPETGISEEKALSRAKVAFSEIEDALVNHQYMPAAQVPPKCSIESVSIEDQDFIEAVDKAKTYIRGGDIMQAVLSRRLQLNTLSNPFDIYRRLRHINPSPYLFYIRFSDVTLIGSSPEVMVKLRGDTITSLPIAGTRPRGTTYKEDEQLAADLMQDEKERAEHLMLLDLARNDVGRVSLPGSVRVISREQVKYYSHVMHIVSCVQGQKKANLTNIDVLKACFPAGTVSGAPKVRAMEIIDELEGMCRGPYAGAAGYLSFNGDIDTGIAIRTIFIRNKKVYVQAGAGIVWDSQPKNELKEIDNKLRALGWALGGMA